MVHARTLGVLAIVGAVAIGLFFRARRARTHHTLAVEPGETELVVPHMEGMITLDGDLDDSGWLGPVARTGPFVDKSGGVARPYSEARITWGDGVLYLSLYAADQNIVVRNALDDDAFHFVFDDGVNERSFDVSATATIASATRSSGNARSAQNFAWNSGAHASREIDGTLNDPRDDDEEWALEIAIPLESIGLRGEAGERVRFAIHRCDSPKEGGRTCASWGERSPAILVLSDHP